MAVTTKKTFPATSNATTTAFTPVGIQLNNQDDLDVYVTLSGGTRVLQLRQATASTAVGSGVNKHPQVNDTTGLYFPAVTAGTNLINYTLSTDNNTITFNSALPQGAVVFCERRTRDADGTYTSFASGSTIRATDLNNSATESNFTAQDGRNKALTIEGVLFRGDQASTNFVTTDHIVNDSVTADKIPDNTINSEHYVDGSIDTAHIANAQVTTAKIADSNVTTAKIADNNITTGKILNSAVTTAKIADLNVTRGKLVNDAVNEDKLADLAVREEHILNSAVTSNKIANNAVTTSEILNGAVTRAKLEADAIDGTKLADNAVDSEHYTDGSIDRVHLEADIIDSTKLADNAVNSEHYVDGSIDREHLAAGIVDGTKIAAAAISTDKVENNAITDSKIATGTLDNRYFTETELANGALDGRYFTETESDARYFNVSTGDTIKDGDAFPDNDTTIATTAAINDRIIDLVDDVGGFVPIANETSFPTANPDVNNGSGTLVSIKSISSTRTPSSGTVTIANGAGTGNTVSITGCGSTVLTAGFGVIVETTSTLHTYAFHRLVPKATEVTTVAGISSNITTVANNTSNINAVAADASDIGTVAGSITNVNNVGNSIANVNTTAGSIANVNTTATNIANVNNVGNNISNVNAVHNNASNINSAVSNASNINSAVSNASNINTVAGSISNVNTTAGSISNVNTVASNISNVNSFFNVYRIGSSNPTSSLDTGDLFFNTTSNSLKVYTGSAWVDGVTATGNFAVVTGNTFTGSNNHNDNVKSIYGTGSDLEIYHDGSDSYIAEQGTGRLFVKSNLFTVRDAGGSENMILAAENSFVKLSYDNAVKLETRSNGVFINGDLDLDDSDKVRIGTGNDLQIFHGGTDSHIENSTGQLKIAGDAVRSTNAAVSESQALFTANGAVELYYNNIKKLATTANGIKLNDDTRIGLGDGEDLQVYHDGSNSYITEGGTGDLYIQGSHIMLENTNGENYFKGIQNSRAELYFDGVKKLETLTGGAKITGTATATGSLIVGSGNEFQVTRSSGNTEIQNYSGTLLFGNASSNLNNVFIRGRADENSIVCIPDGAVELYHNNVKKFETTSIGASLTGRLGCDGLDMGDSETIRLGSSQDLQIYHDGTFNYIAAPNNHEVHINANSGGSTENMAKFKPNGAVELFYDASKKLETTSGGASVTGELDVSGSIDMNTDTGRLKLGAGDDLSLWHDGSNSYIANTSGQLRIWAKTDGYAITCTADGSVDLYHNNVKKFETTSGGVNVVGALTVNGSAINTDLVSDTSPQLGGTLDANGQVISFPDSDGSSNQARFGTGNDLRLYHQSNSSYILNTTGNLNIASNNEIRLKGGSDAAEMMIKCVDNGRVELYHDSVLNLKTNTNGVYISTDGDQGRIRLADTSGNIAYQITGQDVASSGESGGRMVIQDANGGVVADMRTSGGNMFLYNTVKLNGNASADNLKLIMGAGEDLQLFHNGSNSFITNGTGGLYIRSDTLGLEDQTNGHSYLGAQRDGAVTLRYDNSVKLSTISDGIDVDGSITCNDLITAGAVLHENDTNTLIHFDAADEIAFKTGGVTRMRVHNTLVRMYRNTVPDLNNTYDLGSTSLRWRNIYTNDLHLSNEGHSNEVDGTWGNWTIQEGESDLFLKNNRSGKKYKFNLTEVS